MKKKLCCLMILVLMSLCACSKKEVTEPFVSEDYQQGNSGDLLLQSIMETEKGFYYRANVTDGNAGGYGDNVKTLHDLHYVDKETGKNIYLCNKPECKHDGNEFCVATKNTFQVGGYYLYSNRILMAVVEETETHYEYKLLSVSLDGSQLSEVVTYYSTEKTGFTPQVSTRVQNILVHRNQVYLPIHLRGVDKVVSYYGVAFVNLDTMEVTYENKEEPVQMAADKAVRWEDVQAVGNYFFYWVQENHKKVLYRRHITDGTVEMMNLLPNFKGNYVVCEEDTVLYTRTTGMNICIYHVSEDRNEEIENPDKERGIGSLLTDGTYVYYGMDFDLVETAFGAEKAYFENYVNHFRVKVLDLAGQEVKEIDLGSNYFYWKETEKELYCWGRMNFLGEHIFIQNAFSVYECDRDKFLSGEAEFTKVYDFATPEERK